MVAFAPQTRKVWEVLYSLYRTDTEVFAVDIANKKNLVAVKLAVAVFVKGFTDAAPEYRIGEIFFIYSNSGLRFGIY